MKQVKVLNLPPCDMCPNVSSPNLARYDGKTTLGFWANMCPECFSSVGIGLGTGKGQKLIVAKT